MNKNRLYFFKKLSQQNIDIKSFPGVKIYLFEPLDWNYINVICNQLNNNIIDLSQKQLDLRKVVITQPGIGESQYSNSLKNIIKLSKWFFKVLTLDRTNQKYSENEILNIIDNLISTLNTMSFPESTSSDIKSELVSQANIWRAKIKPEVKNS
jgi:hypothetical protein